MTHETYMLIVCAIVYVMMASVSIAVIMALTKMSLKLIRHGAEDEQLIKEYGKKRKNKGTFAPKISLTGKVHRKLTKYCSLCRKLVV